jgi:hypothetical protein
MKQDHVVLDTQTAYATATRNVDFNVPAWARNAIFHWDISAVDGTTPIADCKFQVRDLTSGQYRDIRAAAFGQQTGATRGMYLTYGPDVVDAAGDGENSSVQGILPWAMRAVFAFDRTTGDETYTYTLSVTYKG